MNKVFSIQNVIVLRRFCDGAGKMANRFSGWDQMFFDQLVRELLDRERLINLKFSNRRPRQIGHVGTAPQRLSEISP